MRYMNIGDEACVRIPHSEVCMHMGIAGQVLQTKLVSSRAVQIYKDGKPFSHPVLTGEAGYYHEGDKIYVHDI